MKASTRSRPEQPAMTAVQLEAAISDKRLQVAALQRRLPDLDEAIQAAGTLLGEAEGRLQAQEAAVCRAQLATGRSVTIGPRDGQRKVTYTNGRGTVQLAGPRPLGTPEGQADHERRVYAAIEAEVQPIRAAVVSLERERADVVRAIGLAEGEIQQYERQLGQLRTQEAEHAQLTGPLGWRDRLSAILRRVGAAA